MSTYHILTRDDVCLKERKWGKREDTRRDFAWFLYSAVPNYLTDDLAEEIANQLAGVSEGRVRGALGRALASWRDTCCYDSPPSTDWDDLSVGDHVYLKSYNWVQEILSIRTIKKECGDEQIYHVEMLGWYTLTELKEKFYLVVGE